MVLYIVDDEINIRESLAAHMPWDTLGIDTIVMAKNGSDALLKMSDTAPDILITDVRMPKMNGIELSKTVKEQYPDCQILFLSGYADKEYLLSAIEVKANKYIEKPVNKTEIFNAVKDAISQVNAILKSKEEFSKLKNDADKNLLYKKEALLLQLISMSEPYEKIITNLDDHTILNTKGRYHTLHYCKIYWPSKSQPLKVKSELFNDAFLLDSGSWFAFNALHHLILLLPDKLSSKTETDFLEPFQNHLLKTYSFQFSIGTSKTITSLENVKAAYEQAREAADLGFFKGLSKYYIYDNLADDKPFSVPSLNAFQEAIHTLSKENATSILRHLRAGVISHMRSEETVRALYRDYFIILNKAVSERDIDLESDMFEELINDKHSFNQLTDLHNALKQAVSLFFDKSEEKRQLGNRTYDIMQFINNNLSNDQLSVNLIAQHFDLSQAYLSSVFKKNTTTTVNGYITGARIKKAKELLLGTNFKVYEVSLAIGITDTNYFSVFFKKHTGMSPLDFKENK